MTTLDQLDEGGGSIIVGWLAPHVLYSRLEGVISEDLGYRLARRLTLSLGDDDEVIYFTDTSTISSFDLKAFTAVIEAMTTKRDHFRSIVAFTGQIPMSAKAKALPEAFAHFEYASTIENFEARLRSAAPAAHLTTLVRISGSSPDPAPGHPPSGGPRQVALSFVNALPRPAVELKPPAFSHRQLRECGVGDPSLAQLFDRTGSVSVGWLGHRILYARFEKTISAELGARFVELFAWFVGAATGLHYFCDFSDVSSCVEGARTCIRAAVLARNAQLARVVIRRWEPSPAMDDRAFAHTLGRVEYVDTLDDLQRGMSASMTEVWREAVVLSAGASEPTGVVASASIGARHPRRAPSSGYETYTYVFELDDFERGHFIATRFLRLSARPAGAWVCVARSDEHALVLARQASISEWAQPKTRNAQDFTVDFHHEPPSTPRFRTSS